MKHLLLVMLFLSAGKTFALPPCPASGYLDNCFGAYKYDDGDQYVGGWKDDKPHGQGTYTWGSGENTLVSTRAARSMVKAAPTHFEMDRNTKGNGRTAKGRGKVLKHLLTADNLSVSGSSTTFGMRLGMLQMAR